MEFWVAFWLILEIFVLVAYLQLLFFVFSDLLGDPLLSGMTKAFWALALLFTPVLGAFLYLVVRGAGMGARRSAARTPLAATQAPDPDPAITA